ncbi:hypothetical protein [Vreelandella jeotgali]|uniref:hypothetical protein n=1 Tax=Vreelandella jeotgali TaxID=553386 RepID=UPI00034B2A8B|nr:hypothetical protein [Halomonas jeotgali]
MNPALKWIPLTLAGALALAGCARDGFYDDRNTDYVEPSPAPPLALPDTRDPSRYRNALPMPGGGDQSAPPEEPVEAHAPRALTVASGLDEDYVTTRQINDQRWLVVAEDAAGVWPQLERFARTRAGGIERSRPARGVLETPDATLQLKTAVRNGTSEVHCRQGEQPSSRCLTRLAEYLKTGQRSANTLSSLNAQRDNEDSAVQLRQNGDDVSVSIPYSADRAWAEIDHYLGRDFSQPDKREQLGSDPDAHTFTVDYRTLENRRRGVFANLNPFAHHGTQKVRLVLDARGGQSRLKAESADGQSLGADSQRELLERISGYLR